MVRHDESERTATAGTGFDISAIVMAFWDIAGRLHKVPVYRCWAAPRATGSAWIPLPERRGLPGRGRRVGGKGLGDRGRLDGRQVAVDPPDHNPARTVSALPGLPGALAGIEGAQDLPYADEHAAS